MQAEIIAIGDEILIGQVTDTNSGFIAKQLLTIGIETKQISAIHDEREPILNAMAEAAVRTPLVLVTGGLGPTRDDITKQTICDFFKTKMVLHADTLSHIKTLFSSRNLSMPEINMKQAELPETCIPLFNSLGTAPGMWFEPRQDAKSLFIFMPGVPYEMEAMMRDEIIPRLKNKFQNPWHVQKTILTQGIGESSLMELIHGWEESIYHEKMKLAYLPSYGSVRLRISLSGNDKESIEDKINIKVSELKTIIPQYFSGEKDEKPEEIIGNILRVKNQRLAVAESCTGGYISHLITSVPGSSDYFTGSVVSYSNDVKIIELGVKSEDLEKYGAVSKVVVETMATGIRDKFEVDYSMAVSGIAGPGGGTAEKPVGTVWIAVAGPERIVSKKYLFGKSREKNIKQAAAMAMVLLRKEIIKNN